MIDKNVKTWLNGLCIVKIKKESLGPQNADRGLIFFK